MAETFDNDLQNHLAKTELIECKFCGYEGTRDEFAYGDCCPKCENDYNINPFGDEE